MNIEFIKFLPLLPVVAMIVSGVCVFFKPLKKLAAISTIVALLIGFGMVVSLLLNMGGVEHYNASHTLAQRVVTLFTWFQFDHFAPTPWFPFGHFTANFSFFIDSLTVLMLLVVSGVGLLIAIYASGYMCGDPGYARFFAYVSFFIFAMLCVVMADNLVLLYLGWEGVGLASYLLIGFYFEKPSAVAAAQKAFIVNRVGDLGFALGIFCVFMAFGTVEYTSIIPAAQALLGQIHPSELAPAAAEAYHHAAGANSSLLILAPFMLMLGAFGKSAQIPLFVWLPDAMEGPTPVSALIHAATMVTSGVYMISRLLPVFELSPFALPTVAVIGAATALFGASIALVQTDLKRVWAYSTVSQLGYMFLGVGVLSTVGGVFHLMSHAFFKALLFLTAGSVMHALAGQLDLRKISGLISKMPITAILMLVGALSLAGFPGTAGFFSKDMIIADAWLASAQFSAAFHSEAIGQNLAHGLAISGLITALLTAFYAFRLWFRVFLGPVNFELGDDHHGHDADTSHADHGHDAKSDSFPVEHHHDVHEVSWLLNGPLVILAILALGFGIVVSNNHFVEQMVLGSTAQPFVHAAGAAPTEGSEDAAKEAVHHTFMYISSGIAIVGILAAAYLNFISRATGDAVAKSFGPIVTFLYNKWYIDELYDNVFVGPLKTASELLFIIDSFIIEGVVGLIGFLPRAVGSSFQSREAGSLQGYGLSMAFGGALVVLLFFLAFKS